MTSRKLVFTAVPLVAAIGLLASAASAGCPKEGEQPPANKPKVTCVLGAVKSVDAKALTIVLTTGKGDDAKDVTMKVCPKATILVNGKAAKLADVKTGAAAKVCQIKSKAGDLVAVRIAIGSACCPKKPGGSAGGSL